MFQPVLLTALLLAGRPAAAAMPATAPLRFERESRYIVEVCDALAHPVLLTVRDGDRLVQEVPLSPFHCERLDAHLFRRGHETSYHVSAEFHETQRAALVASLEATANRLAVAVQKRAEWEGRRDADLAQKQAAINGEAALRLGISAGFGAAAAAIVPGENAAARAGADYVDSLGTPYDCVTPGEAGDDGSYTVQGPGGKLCKLSSYGQTSDMLIAVGAVGALYALFGAYDALENAEAQNAWRTKVLQDNERTELNRYQKEVAAITSLDDFYAKNGDRPFAVEPRPMPGYRGGVSPWVVGALLAAPVDGSWNEDWTNNGEILPWGGRADVWLGVSPEFRVWPGGTPQLRHLSPLGRLYLHVGADTFGKALNTEGAYQIAGEGGNVTYSADDPLALRFRQLRGGATLRVALKQEAFGMVGGGVQLRGNATLYGWSPNNELYGADPTDAATLDTRGLGTGWYGQVGGGASFVGTGTESGYFRNSPTFLALGLLTVEQFPDWQIATSWPVEYAATGEPVALPSGRRVSLAVGLGVSY